MTKQYTYTKNKDGFMGSENRIEKTELSRIADAMEEILRLVKADQEQYKKKEKNGVLGDAWEKREEDAT